MLHELKIKARNTLTKLVNTLTNSRAVSEGNVLYDRSSLATKTSQILHTEEKASSQFAGSLEQVADNLHPGFTFRDHTFNITRPGMGTQQYVSTHYTPKLEPGFIGIYHGDYKIYGDKISQIPKGKYSEDAAMNVFFEMLKNNLRLSIPSEVVKELADERGISYQFTEDLISDAIVTAKLKNLEHAKTIENAEPFLIPEINKKDIAKNCMLIQVEPHPKGIRKIGPYQKQLIEYKIKQIAPLTIKRTNQEENPYELLKELIPDASPKSDIEAVANYIVAYSKQNPNKSLIVLTEGREEKAIELGDLVQSLTNKSVPVEPIVEDKPQHYDNALSFVIKKSPLFKKILVYGGSAVLGTSLLFFAYRGIFPEKFVKPHIPKYELKINNSSPQESETEIHKDSTIEVLSDGRPVLTHKIKLSKQEQKSKKKEEKKKESKFLGVF